MMWYIKETGQDKSLVSALKCNNFEEDSCFCFFLLVKGCISGSRACSNTGFQFSLFLKAFKTIFFACFTCFENIC